MEVKLNVNGTEITAYDKEYEQYDDNYFWEDPEADCCDYYLKVNDKEYLRKSTKNFYDDCRASKNRDIKLDFSKKEDWQNSEEFIDNFITQTFDTQQSFSDEEIISKAQRISAIEAEMKTENEKNQKDPLYNYLSFFQIDYMENTPTGGISFVTLLNEENRKLMVKNLHAIAHGKPIHELSVKDVLSFRDRNFNPKKYKTISQMIAGQNENLKKITPQMLDEIGATEKDFASENYDELGSKRFEFIYKKYYQLEKEKKQLVNEVFDSVFLPPYRAEKIKQCDEYCDKYGKSRGPRYDPNAPKTRNEQIIKQAVKKTGDLKKRIARQDLSERGLIPEKEKVSGVTKIGEKASASKISLENLKKLKNAGQQK